MTNSKTWHNWYTPATEDIYIFCMNVLSVLVAYSFFEKKPSINIDKMIRVRKTKSWVAVLSVPYALWSKSLKAAH
jgi:hypothetical protein